MATAYTTRLGEAGGGFGPWAASARAYNVSLLSEGRFRPTSCDQTYHNCMRAPTPNSFLVETTKHMMRHGNIAEAASGGGNGSGGGVVVVSP